MKDEENTKGDDSKENEPPTKLKLTAKEKAINFLKSLDPLPKRKIRGDK